MKFLLKNWVAWVPLAIALAIIFYPLIWGMVPSPNDIYFNYDPWREGSFEKFASNSSLNDPATGYWTKAALFRNEPSTFFWNPYLACGMPGHADLLSGMLNLFVLIPTLISLKGWYALMLLMKVAAAYAGMVLLVRAWGLGPAAGAAAGLAWAFFGQNMVFLWWPQTNISVLFPWLLLLPMLRNRRWFFALSCLLFLSVLGSGFPAYVLYFTYLFLAFLLSVDLKGSVAFLKKAAAPLVLCLLMTSPFLWITWQDLKSNARLDERIKAVAAEKPLPLCHLGLLLSPDAFGGPQGYRGIPGFPAPNNYHSGAVYMGVPALLLIVLGLLGWKETRNRFFALAALILLFLLYVPSPLRVIVGKFPGVGSSPFHRLIILLGLVLAALAAFGMERLMRRLKKPGWGAAIPLVLAVDLGFAAAGFLPYQKWGDVLPKKTEGLVFLENKIQGTPYRVAPLYDALWPNTSEWTRLADVRSHFASEGWYRGALETVEPESTRRMGTLITFWGARTAFHPWLGALFVKYVVEPPMIRTVENGIAERTVREAAGSAAPLPPYGLKRTYQVLGTPYRLGFQARSARDARLRLTVRDDFNKLDLEAHEMLVKAAPGLQEAWVDLRDPSGLAFSRVEIELLPLEGEGVSIGMKRVGEPAFCVDYSPLQPVYRKADLAVFENRAITEPCALYFHVTGEVPASPERWRAQAVLDPAVAPAVEKFLKSAAEKKSGQAVVRSSSLQGAALEVSTTAPALLVLPFKFNPLWQTLRLDGAGVRPMKVNAGMTGVLLSAGSHQVTLQYGRKFIPYFLGSALLLLIAIVWAAMAWLGDGEQRISDSV
jgi:hypothetical protein